MVWNQKLVFRIFLIFLIVVYALIIYLAFFGDSYNSGLENLLENAGFKSSEDSDGGLAVPLGNGSFFEVGSSTSGGSSGGGSSGGGAGASGSGVSGGEAGQTLRFCTFDAYHIVNGEVPCRCGFSAVCYELGNNCDATFNNGGGFCS